MIIDISYLHEPRMHGREWRVDSTLLSAQRPCTHGRLGSIASSIQPRKRQTEQKEEEKRERQRRIVARDARITMDVRIKVEKEIVQMNVLRSHFVCAHIVKLPLRGMFEKKNC